jgi:fumarate hydratase subunit alpha
MGIEKTVEKTAVEILRRAVIYLPNDVKEALKNAYKNETSEAGKTQLKAILDNIELGERNKTPICQDTGVILFYVTVGKDFGDSSYIPRALQAAVRAATAEVPLRPNAVHPLTRKNSGDNTGVNMPYINWDLGDGDYVEITAMPKGAGSENMSGFAMLTPAEGESTLKRFVIDRVISAGAQPCPPTIIGVGVGGSSDVAMKLAKKALLRPANMRHSEPQIANLEKAVLDAVNMTGIGPMGLGGKFTSLAVNIEYAHCHTASLPVGLNMQCWAARRATARIHRDGAVEILS